MFQRVDTSFFDRFLELFPIYILQHIDCICVSACVPKSCSVYSQEFMSWLTDALSLEEIVMYSSV